jgi:hypothetical protein
MEKVVKSISKLNPVMSFGEKLLKKANFGAEYTVVDNEDDYYPHPLLSILSMIILISALYLAFKCKGGFDLGQFLLALCCSPFYLAYRLAVPCK